MPKHITERKKKLTDKCKLLYRVDENVNVKRHTIRGKYLYAINILVAHFSDDCVSEQKGIRQTIYP